MTPPVHVRPTTYSVSCLPADHREAFHFTITVEARGRELWAVLWAGRGCLSKDGEWDHEPLPSNRDEEWLASHRFDLDTALRLARREAPNLKIMRHTVDDVLNDRY